MGKKVEVTPGEMLDIISRSSVVHTSERTELYNIYDFEKLVRDGSITDKTATARLVIGGFANDSYHIYIDRRLIARSTGLITYEGLLKMYDATQLEVEVTYKAQRFFTREEFKRNKAETRKNKNKKQATA